MSKKFTMEDIYIGDDVRFNIYITDTDNLPLDLSNRTFWFTIKIDKDDKDPGIFQKSWLLPISEDSQNGIFVFELTSKDTLSIKKEGTYHCDIRISQIGESQVIYKTLEGMIEIELPVTQFNYT